MKHSKLVRLIVAASTLSMAIVAVAGVQMASASSKTIVTVAYTSDNFFDTTTLGTKWWNTIQTEFNKDYPKYQLQLQPIGGGEDSLLDKLSLDYRTPSTAPDVAQFPSSEVGEYASSGYLLPIGKYLDTTSWFSTFPKAIQNEGNVGGKIYSVSSGETDSILYYNEAMFKKAGIAVPWQPKTWQDILTAAKAVKKVYPKVSALWLEAGTGAGSDGLLQGINNLIVASSTPTIQTSSGKMVVSSPGILEALNFYHTAYSDGLGAPESQLFSTDGVDVPTVTFHNDTLAMALGGNFFGGNWSKTVSAPYWPNVSGVIGLAYLPNYSGVGTSGGQAGGWGYSISSATKDPQGAFDFIKLAEDTTNLIDTDNWAGVVPPAKVDWTVPAYVNFSNPYDTDTANVLEKSVEVPSSANYAVWAQGMMEATGAIVQHPSTTGQQAMTILKNYVTNQLGPSEVTTLK